MPPLASIDVGSNTIRLLIGRISNSRITRLRNEMVITRLAEGLSGTGLLQYKNIEKSVSVLKGFSGIISGYGVTHIRAVGTSALREAKNSEEFIQRVLSETGIKIEVVSGEREADLTAKGVTFSLPEKCPVFIIDIGGGSTEWILCEGQSLLRKGTIPKGVVKLFEACIKTDPPSKDDIDLLNRETAAILTELKAEIKHLISSKTVFIGTAGTITTLASVDIGLEKYDHEKINMHMLSLNRLYKISEMLTGIPLAERKNIKGLEPERADLIIPGILFTIKIMEAFNFNNMLVSDNGLLEGILIELSEEVFQG